MHQNITHQKHFLPECLTHLTLVLMVLVTDSLWLFPCSLPITVPAGL